MVPPCGIATPSRSARGTDRDIPRHFFCRHDTYGKGEPVYMIERRCGAHPDLAVGDDSPWVVLNASAWEASADPGLRDVLRYLRTGGGRRAPVVGDRRPGRRVQRGQGWVDRVLTYEQETEMRCRRARRRAVRKAEEGREEGREEGEARQRPHRRSAGRRPFRRRGRCGGGKVRREELYAELGI